MSRATARPAPMLPLRESVLQAHCKETLAWSRYRVLDTSEHIRACPQCGHRDHRSGQQRGLPDLLIRQDDWPVAFWAAIELKTARGRLTPEQRVIHETGGSVVARSVEEVLEAAARLREAVMADRLPTAHEGTHDR